MKYGTVIRLLTTVCVVIIQLTGCSPDTEDMKRSLADIPIRIVAEMNKGTGASRMTKAPVHSGGGGMEGKLYRCGGIRENRQTCPTLRL